MIGQALQGAQRPGQRSWPGKRLDGSMSLIGAHGAAPRMSQKRASAFVAIPGLDRTVGRAAVRRAEPRSLMVQTVMYTVSSLDTVMQTLSGLSNRKRGHNGYFPRFV